MSKLPLIFKILFSKVFYRLNEKKLLIYLFSKFNEIENKNNFKIFIFIRSLSDINPKKWVKDWVTF
jgi:hypothetical protein